MNDPHNIFSPEASSVQEEKRPARTVFGNHIGDRRWCAWAVRDRLSGPTKVPTKVPFIGYTTYDGVTTEWQARSNDPQKWLPLQSALHVAKIVGAENNAGIFLGTTDIIPGYRLGGVDYDTCFDEQGEFLWWAAEVYNRLNTYTEVSPSGKGVKGFFLYQTEDVERIAELIRPATTGRQFKVHGQGNHPPGIEWYYQGRFFAVTANLYPGSPETINAISYEDLVWLTKDLGPRISKRTVISTPQDKINKTKGVTTAAQSVTSGGPLDQSRSGRTYTRVWQLRRREGLESYADIKAALLDDDDSGIRDWMHEKGLVRDEYEFARIVEKTKPIRNDDILRCRFAQMQRRHRLDGDTPLGLENPRTLS